MSKIELTFKDTIKYIEKIPDYQKLTLIGGQALCFWSEYYGSIYGESVSEKWLISTRDIDFMGNQDTLRECAKAWNAKPEFPSKEDHTANSGIILIDHDGDELRIDFLWDVVGLTKTEVEAQRLKMYIPDVHENTIPFYILSPYLCLVSRISNVIILKRTDTHTIEQLKASVEIVNFHINHLLDSNEEKLAREIAEKVYKIAYNSNAGVRIFVEYEIDIFQAIPEDARFNKKFLEERFPRMKKAIFEKQSKKINNLRLRRERDKD